MRVTCCVALLFAMLLDCSPTSAAIRARSRSVVRTRQVKARQVNRQEVKVLVPFAVPVGVPVAPFAPYFYSYGQFRVEPAVETDSTTAPVVRGSPELSTTSSLVTAKCATCHGGSSPQGEVRLDQPEFLDASNRLAAIRAVLAGRMPKGGTLTPEELRTIVSELARE